MQIVACQLDIAWENKPANFDRVRTMLARADIKPGALIVLPEMFAVGFSMHVDAIAEPEDGPTHVFLAELAQQFHSAVIGGVVTRAEDGRGRNQAVVFGPDGELLARYSKLHPFSFASETKYYEAGSDVLTFSWQGFVVAPLVCYDLRFPEAFRRAVRRGAELMVVIANWPQPREPHWLALLRARAIENQAYVLGVNRAGDDPHVHYGGHSLLVDPRGETVAEAGEAAGVVVAEIEHAPLEAYRQQFPALADIRGDLLAE